MENDADRSHEQWKYLLEWANAIVSVLTLGAVVFYGAVAYKQWGQMVRAVDEAKRSADVAQKQLNLLSQERRAWAVATILGEYPFEPNKEVRMNLLVKNSGKLSAHHATTKYTIALFPWPSGELPKTLHNDPPPKPFFNGLHENVFIAPGDAALHYGVLPRVRTESEKLRLLPDCVRLG